MLRVSLTILFLCLLPAILMGFDIPAPIVWKIAVGTVLITGSYNWYSSIRMTNQLSSKEGPSLNQTVRYANMALGSFGILLQIVALSRIVQLNLAGVYLLSVSINLLIASLVFFALIQQLDLQRLEGEEEIDESKNT